MLHVYPCASLTMKQSQPPLSCPRLPRSGEMSPPYLPAAGPPRATAALHAALLPSPSCAGSRAPKGVATVAVSATVRVWTFSEKTKGRDTAFAKKTLWPRRKSAGTGTEEDTSHRPPPHVSPGPVSHRLRFDARSLSHLASAPACSKCSS